MANKTEKQKKSRPTLTAEARENEMIGLAVDLAEKQLREGTASSQVITHYLKLATTKERYEKELMIKEIELKQAKVDELKTAKRIEELYKDALDAMRIYKGEHHDDVDD